MAIVGPKVCDPTSDESRRALIANIIPYSENVERPAKPLVEMVCKLRTHGTWVNEIEGDPKTWGRFCIEVLGRPSGWFDDLEHGVGLLTGGSIQQAQDIAQKVASARENPAAKHGGDRKSEHDQVRSTNLKSSDTADRVLARLARDGHDELLDAIEAGEISVNQAAIQVGYRKKKTPEELAIHHFNRCESRLVVLKAICESLEPHEREVVDAWLQERDA